MAIRIQLRHDTSTNWSNTNPLLYPGEFGIETDTLKIKVGPMVESPAVGTAWNSISSYANITADDLGNSLGDYIELSTLGQGGGPAELTLAGNLVVPGQNIIIEGATADSYELTLHATDPTADRTITFPDATGTVALTTDLPRMTITQVAVDGTATETYSNISTIAFDEDSGFDVTSPSTGVAKIAMNSTFKYWEVDGVQKLTAQGLDTVNFMSGTGIEITADGEDDPQSISISVDDTIATKTYTSTAISTAISGLIDSAPSTLDTLNELAAAINDDASYASTITTALGNKQDKVTGVSDTEIGYLDGVTSAIQTQLNAKQATLPSQLGNSGKYLTNDGSGTLSWGTVSGYLAPTIGSTQIDSGSTVTEIEGLTLKQTSSTSITSNAATVLDTNALADFTTIKYLVSIKQGGKIRSSEVIVQTDGTSVDYAEYGVIETGGIMNGIIISASVSSTDCVLKATIIDAASTNATVKIQKVLI